MGLKRMRLKEEPITHFDDCQRMLNMMLSMDYLVELKDIHTAYTEYSDMYAANWLFIPDDDMELGVLCEELINQYFYEDEDWSGASDRASNY